MKKTAIAVLLALFIVPLTSSVGVANSYWDEKPLKLAPGESTTISLRLQNEETEPVIMNVSIESDIASLEDGSTYEVPPGRISVPVYIKVSIPKDVGVGTTYNIPVSFKQIASGEGQGFFQVAQGITGKVPVEVVSEEESELFGQEKGLSTGAIIAILAIIAAFVAIILYRKRNK